mmetsp:Transcript_33180/g.69817  ORF Transcript_33180/g.69817 Transcript_33180/m.69817 type:complete len:90 (+) Transcript_33180:41-310(+)
MNYPGRKRGPGKKKWKRSEFCQSDLCAIGAMEKLRAVRIVRYAKGMEPCKGFGRGVTTVMALVISSPSLARNKVVHCVPPMEQERVFTR